MSKKEKKDKSNYDLEKEKQIYSKGILEQLKEQNPSYYSHFSINDLLRWSFNSYQKFVNNIKIYPEEHKIVYPTLGMMGEAGEVSEKIKKWLRRDKELDKAELIKELGDVLWYIAALADDLDSSIEEVAEINIAKLSKRKDDGKLQGNGDNR